MAIPDRHAAVPGPSSGSMAVRARPRPASARKVARRQHADPEVVERDPSQPDEEGRKRRVGRVGRHGIGQCGHDQRAVDRGVPGEDQRGIRRDGDGPARDRAPVHGFSSVRRRCHPDPGCRPRERRSPDRAARPPGRAPGRDRPIPGMARGTALRDRSRWARWCAASSSSMTTPGSGARHAGCSSGVRSRSSARRPTRPRACSPRSGSAPTSSSSTSSSRIRMASRSLRPSSDDPRPPDVVLMSTRDASDYGDRVARSGANGFIQKARLSVLAHERAPPVTRPAARSARPLAVAAHRRGS